MFEEKIQLLLCIAQLESVLCGNKNELLRILDFHSVKKTFFFTSECLTYLTLTSLLPSILGRSPCGLPNFHCAVQVLLDPMDTEAMFNIEIIDHVGI